MRIAIERIEPVDCRPEVLEIVAPRTNTAAITAAENFFSGLALGAPFCLEIAATETARWFQLRTLEPVARRLVQEHLQVAYPQSRLRQVDAEYQPGADPAAVAPEGRAAACVLTLQEPEYLPLRTFGDLDLGERAGSQADPMLGILSALGTVPPGGRAISQLVLRAAPVNWSRPYLRMGVEHALASERSLAAAQAAASTSDSSGSVTALAVGMVALSAVGAWRYGFIAIDWHEALKYGPLAVGGGAGLLALSRWLHPARPIYDQEQVRDKISRVGFRTELRLAVSGPADISQGDLDACLDRIVAAYGVFGLASGNRFARRRLKLNGRDLRKPGFFGRAKKVPVLNARELAGLWHLPLAQAEVPLLERTGARRILPLPETVASGCRIGLSNHQGRAFPVCLSEAVLRRHLLVIAKTGRGKSALLARLALFVLETLSAGGKQPALILIDPHRDLAYLTLGSMPAHRLSSAVFLDAANEDRPFGLNLVDAGLGWDRDQMTMMVLQIFRREFSQAWGFRMEAAFRYGLHTLFEANQAICRADPRNGRQRQYTILDLPPLLMDQKFRASVLKLVSDPETRGWWIEVFQRLNHSFQTEVVFPVQTKIFRFAGIQAARRIVGQPCSTIDPLSWVKSGAAVIVNTAAGIIGRDAAALVGDLLLNMVTLTIAQQAAVEREERARATVIVDEIHLMPGADYETLLSEMAKYGANLVLATQSLARLDALDREQDRALRPTIFSNIDGLAVFNTSGEDARYLELELGETINRHDILALAEHECYLRLPNGRDGSSVLCSVQLDPPPQPNVETQRLIAAASAMAYGRDAAAVDRDLLAGLNRIEQTHWTPGERAQAGQQSGTGAPKDDGGESPDEPGAAVSAPRPRPMPPGSQPSKPDAPKDHDEKSATSSNTSTVAVASSAAKPNGEPSSVSPGDSASNSTTDPASPSTVSSPAPRPAVKTRVRERSKNRNRKDKTPTQATYLTHGGSFRAPRLRPESNPGSQKEPNA